MGRGRESRLCLMARSRGGQRAKREEATQKPMGGDDQSLLNMGAKETGGSCWKDGGWDTFLEFARVARSSRR